MSRQLKASNIFFAKYRAARISLHKVVVKIKSQEKITEQIYAAVGMTFNKPAMVFCKDFQSEGCVSSQYWL